VLLVFKDLLAVFKDFKDHKVLLDLRVRKAHKDQLAQPGFRGLQVGYKVFRARKVPPVPLDRQVQQVFKDLSVVKVRRVL
jgi:hypothetical protein